MATSTSIATEATRTAAVQNAADYTNGIGSHIAGDWQQHNQVNVITPEAWRIQAEASPADEAHALHYITNTSLIRMLVTVGTTDYAVIVPGVPSGTFTGNGTFAGSPTAVGPTFTLQPVSGSYTQGSRVVLTVAVEGTPPIILSWARNGVALGETATSLYINNFTYAEVGDYTCTATNALGQTVSSTAILSLKTSTGEPVPTRPF
jgi:hypothetical protein